MTAARLTLGATCLSSSIHLALRLYSKVIKPVVLPPGLSRRSTRPAPTGSETSTNTIGNVRLTRCKAVTLSVPAARTTSGVRATNSAAYLRSRSTFSPQRMSMRMLRPSVQPNRCRACRNAATNGWAARVSLQTAHCNGASRSSNRGRLLRSALALLG